MSPRFLRYQRVRYVGPRFPELVPGAVGIVSDANSALTPIAPGWLFVDFPEANPRRQACKAEWLEADA